VALAVALASGAAVWNLRVYWNGAIVAYRTSAQPHRRASELIRLFETETAAPGNVFILPWPYWLDHRAVLLEAGRTDFDVVPSAPSDAAFAELVERRQGNSPYQPQLDVVFLVHPDDANGLAWLRSRYPEGTFSDFSRKGSGRLGLFRSPARGKRT
jgi:hypothetical protein